MKQSKPCLLKTDKTSSKFKIIKTCPLNTVYRLFVVAWICRGLPLNRGTLASGGITFLSSGIKRLQKGKLLSSIKMEDLVLLIHCLVCGSHTLLYLPIFEDNSIFLKGYLTPKQLLRMYHLSLCTYSITLLTLCQPQASEIITDFF